MPIYKYLKGALKTNLFFFRGEFDDEVKEKFSHLKEGEVILILKDGKLIEKLDKNDVGDVIFDKTVFYAESGGQIADNGEISSDKLQGKVIDCKKLIIGNDKVFFIHKIQI